MIDLKSHGISATGASAATLIAVSLIWGADIRAGAQAAAVVDTIKETIKQIQVDNRDAQKQAREDLKWYFEQLGAKAPPDLDTTSDTTKDTTAVADSSDST